MLKKLLFTIICIVSAAVALNAQTTQNPDTAMILPFENASGKAEFNWVGESFADALSDLLKVPGLNIITNQERKTIQQKLRVPLTILPSLATSLKIAREGKATLLISGKYNIQPAQGNEAAKIKVTAKVFRVLEGRILSEEIDGKLVTRAIEIEDALGSLQNVQGEIAYVILFQLFKSGQIESKNSLVQSANKIPARAFEAYIKGLLTSESDTQTRENFFKNAMRIYADDEKTKNEIYADAALELGHLFLNQQKNSEAIDYLGRAIGSVVQCLEKAKSEGKIPQCKNEVYAEAAFYNSLIYWQQQDYEKSLAVLRPLADDLKLISVYNILGASAIQASRVEKKDKGKSDALLRDGIEFLKRVADNFPDELNAQFNYGLALFLSGNFPESIKILLGVLNRNQKDGEIYFLLAKAFEKIGDDEKFKDADDKARRFLTNDNKYAKFETEWKSGKLSGINLRVEKPLRKDFVSVVFIKNQNVALQKPRDETESLLIQARQLYNERRDDDALAIVKRIILREPMSADAFLLDGMINLRRGDINEATAKLRTALFWNNNLIEAHVLLGRIYIQKNECQSAQTYLVSALAVLKDIEKNSNSVPGIDESRESVSGLKRMVERCSTK